MCSFSSSSSSQYDIISLINIQLFALPIARAPSIRDKQDESKISFHFECKPICTRLQSSVYIEDPTPIHWAREYPTHTKITPRITLIGSDWIWFYEGILASFWFAPLFWLSVWLLYMHVHVYILCESCLLAGSWLSYEIRAYCLIWWNIIKTNKQKLVSRRMSFYKLCAKNSRTLVPL